MTQLTVAQAAYVNKMNPAAKKVGLGTRLRAVEGGSIATGTEAQVPICDAEGVPTPKAISGDVTIDASGAVSIGNDKITNAKMADDAIGTAEIADDAVKSAQVADEAILEPHLKIVNRDVTIPAEGTSATVTNAADINGFLGQAHFIAASADQTAVKIVSVRFVPDTGALTVTVDAAATADTVVRVPVIQAA